MPDKPDDKTPRTLTFRAGLIGIAAMLILAMWVHIHEIVLPGWSILVENSPPAGAVGVFLGVLVIGAAVARLRPCLRLESGELIVIYTMLVTSAPFMTQGMWHRFIGLVIAIPENKNYHLLVDSYSDKLWPHGDHLIADRRFDNGLGPDIVVEPATGARVIQADDSPVGATAAVELINKSAPVGEPPVTRLRLRVRRLTAGGREQIVPGENYYVSFLSRCDDMGVQSRLTVELRTDGGGDVPVATIKRDTPATFSAIGGFMRTGEPYVTIPRDVRDHVELVFTLEGVGRAALTDIVFFNNEAVRRLRKGSREVRAGDLERLADNDRDGLLVRPDTLLSPSGLWYVVKGYIPYRQWLRPLFYWLSIVVAIFLCLLGISVIFRRQWADNERFTFPLVIVPRLLLEEARENGRVIRPLYGHRMFRIGLGVALLYCLLQGLAFYIPGLPDPTVLVNVDEYIHQPEWKAYLRGFYDGRFEIVLVITAIAFYIDLHMLLSIIVFFWVCKVPFYFGMKFGWKEVHDRYPFNHEQHIGSFIALVIVVFWVSRRHLAAVGRKIIGRDVSVDDTGEGMSYRTAALLIVGAFVFFGVWGGMTGLGIGSALVFFGFLIVCGISASRIRTEVGAPLTYFTPYQPYLIFFLLGGLPVFGTQTMLLAFAAGGFMAVAQFLMMAPTQVEMLQLGKTFNARPRHISWALILGAFGGVLLGGYVMLVWAYGVGGENVEQMRNWSLNQGWYFGGLHSAVVDADAQALAAREGLAQDKPYPVWQLAGVGFGAAVTFLLTWLRMAFVGFWLHPVAFILANSYFIYMCWGSLLTALVIKAVALKIGGPRLVREQLGPFFAGILCGALAGMLLWDVIAIALYSHGVQEVFVKLP